MNRLGIAAYRCHQGLQRYPTIGKGVMLAIFIASTACLGAVVGGSILISLTTSPALALGAMGTALAVMALRRVLCLRIPHRFANPTLANRKNAAFVCIFKLFYLTVAAPFECMLPVLGPLRVGFDYYTLTSDLSYHLREIGRLLVGPRPLPAPAHRSAPPIHDNTEDTDFAEAVRRSLAAALEEQQQAEAEYARVKRQVMADRHQTDTSNSDDFARKDSAHLQQFKLWMKDTAPTMLAICKEVEGYTSIDTNASLSIEDETYHPHFMLAIFEEIRSRVISNDSPTWKINKPGSGTEPLTQTWSENIQAARNKCGDAEWETSFRKKLVAIFVASLQEDALPTSGKSSASTTTEGAASSTNLVVKKTKEELIKELSLPEKELYNILYSLANRLRTAPGCAYFYWCPRETP